MARPKARKSAADRPANGPSAFSQAGELSDRDATNDQDACLPYRLPELIEAVGAKRTVFIVEGEAKADALWALGIAATTNPGGAGKWQLEFNEYLRGADTVLVPDNDDPGWRHVNEIGAALTGIAARIRVLALPGLPPKGDVVDWLASGGTCEQFDALVEQAKEWQPPEAPIDEDKAKAAADEQQLIDELARLNARDYDRRRREAAEQLGIRSGTLDDEVAARRSQQVEEAGQPPLFGHWVVEPWPEPVDTGELLLALAGRVKRHIVLSDDEALTVALWVLFAWIHEAAAVHSPILLVTSAEKDCGKTQLVGVISLPYLALDEDRRNFRGGAVPQHRKVATDDLHRRGRHRAGRQRAAACRGQQWLDAKLLCPALHRRRQHPARLLDVLSEGNRHEGQEAARHNVEPLDHHRDETKEDERDRRALP